MSKKIFIDDSTLCAFVDRAHPRHEASFAYFRFFAQGEYAIFIDHSSLIHAYNDIYKDISQTLAKDVMRTLSLSDINIVYPTDSDSKAALKALTTYRSNDLTFEKALIAVLAFRRNIAEVATFDYFPNLFGITPFFLPL